MEMLRSNLPLYYDFYIVAKENSISKASLKHGVAQSNLSRSIQTLEQTVGLVLINRSNKGISLTNDGIELYNKLDEIFGKINTFNNTGELSGTITVGTTRNIADYKIEQYLTKFIKQYPNVNIHFLMDSASNLNDYLKDHKIDVLVDYLPHINYSEKLNIEVRAINKFKTCFACSKDYYKKIGEKIHSLKDLNNYNLVIQGKSRRRQLLDEVLQANNIKLEYNIEMPDSKLMCDFVKHNDYIGYFVEEEVIDNDLVKLNIEETMPENSIGIIYYKNMVNDVTKKFIELVLGKTN